MISADDEVIASGPDEGREALAARFGWSLVRDEETGADELVPLPGAPAS